MFKFAPRRTVLKLLLLLPFVGGASVAQAQSASHKMSVREAHDAAVAGKLVLIDIRSTDEWRETGLPASAHAISMHQQQQTFLSELATATGGSRATPIALICAVGNRSANLQAWMRNAGFTNVIDVAEGMIGGRHGAGWLKTGLPVRVWRPGETSPVFSRS